MAMRQSFFRIYGDVGFGLPVIAVVVDAGKHHGLIWLELGKSFVPPMRCELRCYVSMVLLQNEETRPVLKVSLDHFSSSLEAWFKRSKRITIVGQGYARAQDLVRVITNVVTSYAALPPSRVPRRHTRFRARTTAAFSIGSFSRTNRGNLEDRPHLRQPLVPRRHYEPEPILRKVPCRFPGRS